MKKFLLTICMALPTLFVLGQSPGGVSADLSVWYKGDNGVTTNGSKQVTQWASSSGTNVTLTPSGTAILPYNDQTTYTSTFNFNPTVTFDGTNNYLRNNTTAYLNAAGSVHYIVVGRGVNRNTSPARCFFSLAGNDDGFFYAGAGVTTAFPTIGNNYDVAAAAITTAEDLGIYSAILPKTTGQGVPRGFYNGLKKNYPSPYPYTGAYNLPTTGAYMGADGTSGDNFLGDIAEVILYHNTAGGDLADANLEKIHSYLAVKYGITLTSTQNYITSASQVIWNAGSNSGFTSNIFGIGRDDASALHQKQSKSTNTAQKLIIGNGSSLFSTNALNTNSLTNGQSLLVGDNGLAQKLTVPFVYTAGTNGATNYRFGSVWKVSNTGSVGTVTVAWPKSFSNMYLVQSSDPTFATGNAYTPMNTEITVNGVVYNTATVTLADGQYFTLAGYAQGPGGVIGQSVWLKADKDVTVAAGKVDAWTNQGISGGNATPAYPATGKPDFVSSVHNFNPVVTDNTTAHDGLVLADVFANTQQRALSSFVVQSQPDVSQARTMISYGNNVVPSSATDDPWFANQTATSLNVFWQSRDGNAIQTYPNSLTRYNNIQTVNSYFIPKYVGASNTSLVNMVGMNGSRTNFNRTSNANIAMGNHLFIHQDGGNNNTSGGSISEIISYDKELTADEQQRIDSYLAIKYGVTSYNAAGTSVQNYLNSISNVVWDATGNSAYNNNILGVARDVLSDLHQKQSKSVNANQKLIIGAGNSLSDSNAANTNSLTDGQYLIVGDNGLKQAPAVLITGITGVNYRFESIWKVQNTGSVGTVRVAWPSGLTNLKLIQSSTAIFDGTSTHTNMSTNTQTVNGVTYNYADVTLANGQYFTFAAFVQAPGGVVANLLMWHKADDGTTSQGAKNIWKDVSINGKDITQNNNTAYQPSLITNATYSADSKNYFFNYNPFYYFDGTNDFFYRDFGTNGDYFPVNNGAGSVYGVMFNVGDTGAWRTPYGWGDDTPNLNRRDDRYSIWRNNTSAIEQDVALTETPAHIGGMIWRGGGANGVYLNQNGRIYGATATNIGTIVDRYFAVGSEGFSLTATGNELFQGGMSEVFAYGADHQNSAGDEKQRINSYLAIKYGITLSDDAGTSVPNYLSSTSAVVWNATTNAGYNNNILGIANDFNSALNQKQSISENTNQKLIIGAGGALANTNALNTNSLTDGQFLIVGDNGLKQNLAIPLSYTAGSNGTANFRFESIWKVQNTGTVGTVTVAWPKGVKNLYLVQSNDEVLTGGDTFTPMTTEVTVNGVVYNTATVTLGNGEFFTFAGFGNAPGGVTNNLSYWYRADVSAANTGVGTDVTGWTDVWNGTTVAQFGTNALPKYALGAANYFNFNPGINFTAITQSLANNVVQSVTNASNDIFTVTKEGMTAPGSFVPHFFSITENNATTGASAYDYVGMNPTNGQIERRVAGGGTQFPDAGVNYSTTVPSIMYNTFTNTTLARALNGAANSTPATGYSAVGLALGGHVFGNTRTTTNGVDNLGGLVGDIGETIIYGAGNITATERRKVDSYLAIKYGITLGRVNTDHYLDTDGNQVWNGAANATYNNNIFGVSRDDIEAFEQKVSKSVNAGTILTVATINDFVNPNQDAARTGFATDKTYFVLGDNNNVTTTPVDVTIGTNTYKRIPRVWMAQEKNADAGSLFFEADLASYNSGSYNTTQNMVMLVADDAAFTTNVTVVNPTSSNASKWVFNQNVADSKFITFAKSFPVDVQVNKVGPLSAQTGSTISYTINVTNNGPNNASNVIVKDPVVPNFTATSITCSASAGTLGSATCPASVTLAGLQGTGLTIPSLPDGSVVRFTITGTVGNSSGTVINNVASVEYTNDTDVANNSSTVNTTIYSCTDAETTYAIDVDATLAANTIAVNGGTINMIYKLKSGTAIPGIGTQLIVPVTYSDLNNRFGVDNQWEALGKRVNPGIDPFVVIAPRTTAGAGRLYNSLPANNSTNEALMGSNNNGDNIFTSKILSGDLDPLGNFSISIGNYPAAPLGYIIKAHVLNAYANGNRIATASTNQSGFWLKQLANTGIRNDGTEAVNSSAMMPGSTYVWRYSAFSNGTSFADNNVGTASVRGVTFWEDSSITFAKICDAACYKPGITAGTALDTKVGITALGRAGATDADNWPMTRKGGWLALESKTKGFVPNRVAFSGGNPVGIPAADFREGMMVYDTTNKCLKIFTSVNNGSTFEWHCVTTQTCPD